MARIDSSSCDLDEVDNTLIKTVIGSPVHVSKLPEEEAETIRKTSGLGPSTLNSPQTRRPPPAPLEAKEVKQVSSLISRRPKTQKEEMRELLDEMAKDAENIDPSEFEKKGLSKEGLSFLTDKIKTALKEPGSVEEAPSQEASETSLGWEFLKAGLWKEYHINQEIGKLLDEIELSHDKIALLLDLNAELSGKTGNTVKLSEKAQEIIQKLKSMGIDLKTGKDVAISELKETIGRIEGRLRSQISNLFATKVNAMERDKAALIEALQGVLKSLRDLYSRILANMARR